MAHLSLADEVVLLEQEISTLVKELMELHDKIRCGLLSVRPAAVVLRDVIGVEALKQCTMCFRHYYFIDGEKRCVLCADLHKRA